MYIPLSERHRSLPEAQKWQMCGTSLSGLVMAIQELILHKLIRLRLEKQIIHETEKPGE